MVVSIEQKEQYNGVSKGLDSDNNSVGNSNGQYLTGPRVVPVVIRAPRSGVSQPSRTVGRLGVGLKRSSQARHIWVFAKYPGGPPDTPVLNH